MKKVRLGEPVTIHEIDVVLRLANGQTHQQICEALNVCRHTVTRRLTAFMAKTGAKTSHHAIALAMAPFGVEKAPPEWRTFIRPRVPPMDERIILLRKMRGK